jgi:FAD binding domain.
VTAEIVADGEPVAVRATYMVAADGVRGRAREALGVAGPVRARSATASASWSRPTSK